MKWLKKVGQIILKASEYWTGFAPMANVLMPGHAGTIQVISADIAQIADVVVNAEVLGAALGLPGTDKLKAAAPAVAQIILKSAVLAKHQVADPVLFQQGAQKIADGFADVLNSLKDNVEVVDKAA